MSGKPVFNRCSELAQRYFRAMFLFTLALSVFVIGCTRGSKDFFVNLLPIQSNDPVAEKFAQLSDNSVLTRSSKRFSQETHQTTWNRSKFGQLVSSTDYSEDDPVGRVSISDKKPSQENADGIALISFNQNEPVAAKTSKSVNSHADELHLRAEGLYARAQLALKANQFEQARLLAHSASQLMKHSSLSQSPVTTDLQQNRQLALKNKTTPNKTNVTNIDRSVTKFSTSNTPPRGAKTNTLDPGFPQIRSQVDLLNSEKKLSQPTISTNLASAKSAQIRVPRQSTPARFVGIVIPIGDDKKTAIQVDYNVENNHPGPMQALSLTKPRTGANRSLKLHAGSVLMAPTTANSPATTNPLFQAKGQHDHFKSTNLQNGIILAKRETYTNGPSLLVDTKRDTLLPLTSQLSSQEIQSLEKVNWKVQPAVSSENKPQKSKSVIFVLTIIAVIIFLLVLASRRLRQTARV